MNEVDHLFVSSRLNGFLGNGREYLTPLDADFMGGVSTGFMYPVDKED